MTGKQDQNHQRDSVSNQNLQKSVNELSDTQCKKCGNIMYPKTQDDKKVFFCGYCSNQRDFSEEEILSITRYNKNIKQEHFSPSIRYDPTLKSFKLDCVIDGCKNNVHKQFEINNQQLVQGFMCTECSNVIIRKQTQQQKN